MLNTIKNLKKISTVNAAIRLAFHQAGTKPTYNFHCLSHEIERYCRQFGIPVTQNRIGGKLASENGIIIGLTPKANSLPLIFNPYGSYLPVASFSIPENNVSEKIHKILTQQLGLKPCKVTSAAHLEGYSFYTGQNQSSASLVTLSQSYPTEDLPKILATLELRNLQQHTGSMTSNNSSAFFQPQDMRSTKQPQPNQATKRTA